MIKQLLIILAISTISSTLFAHSYYEVDQKDKTFIPHTLSVKVGDSITFVNSDPFAHNVYSDDVDNEFDVGMQAPNSKNTIIVKDGGDFNVECAIHPNMLLEVTIEK